MEGTVASSAFSSCIQIGILHALRGKRIWPITLSWHASTQVAADFLSYGTRRHHPGVDIETLRQELGHSDITTTQI
jgi:hypothetical protein